MGKKLNSTQVSGILNVGVQMINNWYKWYNDDEFEKPKGLPELPMYSQDKPHTRRYWNEEDIIKLIEFKKYLPRGRAGVMGDYNARNWQDRGKQALINKGKTDLAYKYFNYVQEEEANGEKSSEE